MEENSIISSQYNWARALLGVLAVLLLGIVYVFQLHLAEWSASVMRDVSWLYAGFIFSKSLRLIMNDAIVLLLFISVFNRAAELKLASYVFLAEVVLILPLYFVIKLNLEGDTELSSPLFSFVHRLIVNPLLMLILLGGLLYQRYTTVKP